MREWIGGMDFVSREEFDAVKAMAAKAREENDALRARVVALEAKLGGSPENPIAAPKRMGP
jgi:BMFP domain-containing protein YqiC